MLHAHVLWHYIRTCAWQPRDSFLIHPLATASLKFLHFFAMSGKVESHPFSQFVTFLELPVLSVPSPSSICQFQVKCPLCWCQEFCSFTLFVPCSWLSGVFHFSPCNYYFHLSLSNMQPVVLFFSLKKDKW